MAALEAEWPLRPRRRRAHLGPRRGAGRPRRGGARHLPLPRGRARAARPAAARRRPRAARAWRARSARSTSRPTLLELAGLEAEGLDGVSLRARAGRRPRPATPSIPRRSIRAITSAGASCSRRPTAATATCARRGRSCSTSPPTRPRSATSPAERATRGRGHERLAGAARARAAPRPRPRRCRATCARSCRRSATSARRGRGRCRPARCPIPRTTSRPTRTSRPACPCAWAAGARRRWRSCARWSARTPTCAMRGRCSA